MGAGADFRNQRGLFCPVRSHGNLHQNPLRQASAGKTGPSNRKAGSAGRLPVPACRSAGIPQSISDYCGSESDSLSYDHRRHSGADCGAFRVLRSAAWSRPRAVGGRRCAWRPINCAPWQAASVRASLCISDPLRRVHAADGSWDALGQYSLYEVFDSVWRWHRNHNLFYHVQHPNACGRTEGNAGTSNGESHCLHYDADHVCPTHRATDLWDFS